MAMSGKLTVKEFFKRFPDDDACLERLMDVRYGLTHECRSCGVLSTFHRLSDRKAYSCANCANHVYPQAGTIFQDSRTSLVSWFYVIYMFVATRHGVSGKEIERQIGCTYKTAWRMGMQVRKLMEKADVKGLLMGHVELDEAYVGGRRPGKHGRGASGKTILMGVKERGG
jgi:transposase